MLVFDINGFEQNYPGPWEWDLKRVAASAVVDGRRRILSDPLVLVRLREMLSEGEKAQITEHSVEKLWLEYLDSLP